MRSQSSREKCVVDGRHGRAFMGEQSSRETCPVDGRLVNTTTNCSGDDPVDGT